MSKKTIPSNCMVFSDLETAISLGADLAVLNLSTLYLVERTFGKYHELKEYSFRKKAVDFIQCFQYNKD
jgi:hypothetical protein